MADLSITVALDDSGFSGKLDEIYASLQKLATDTQANFDKLSQAVQKTGDNFGDLETMAARLSTVLIGLFGLNQIKDLLEYANTINQTAKAIGFTTSELVAFQQSVVQAGGSARAASLGIEMFYMKLDQARMGGVQQQVAFERLGLSMMDLKKLDDQAMFKKTLEALAAMPPSAERNRIEVELLSKSFRGIPIQEVVANMKQLEGQFSNTGPVIDDASKAFRTLQANSQTAGQALLTVLQPINKLIADIRPSLDTMVKGFEILGGVLAALAAIRLPAIISAIGTALTFLIGPLTAVRVAIAAIVGIGTWLGLKTAVDANVESNKNLSEAQKKAAEEARALAAANNEVIDKRKAEAEAIREGIANWEKMIQRQTDEIALKAQLAKESKDVQAYREAEARVLDEYAKKIDDVNKQLARSRDLGPENIMGSPAVIKALEDSLAKLKADSAAAGAARGEAAKNAELEAESTKLTAELLKLQKDSEKQVLDIRAATAAKTMNEDQARLATLKKQTEELIAQERVKFIEQRGFTFKTEDQQNALLAVDAEWQKFVASINKGYEEKMKATQDDITLSQNWAAGWEKAWADYQLASTKNFDQAGRMFKTVTQGMEDQLINLFKTGKFGWKEMLATWLEELARSGIRNSIASIFGGGGGGGGGGILSTLWNAGKSLLGFADGGTIPTNEPVLVGERGPEIISGARGMTVTPNSALNNGQGYTNITYNINAVDAMSFRQMVAADPTFIYAVSQQGAKQMPSRR